METGVELATEKQRGQLAVRHLRTGWLGLAVFLLLGLVLEALHGFKIGLYTAPAHHWRREIASLADVDLGPMSPRRVWDVEGVAHARQEGRGYLVAGRDNGHRLRPHLVIERLSGDGHAQEITRRT